MKTDEERVRALVERWWESVEHSEYGITDYDSRNELLANLRADVEAALRAIREPLETEVARLQERLAEQANESRRELRLAKAEVAGAMEAGQDTFTELHDWLTTTRAERDELRAELTAERATTARLTGELDEARRRIAQSERMAREAYAVQQRLVEGAETDLTAAQATIARLRKVIRPFARMARELNATERGADFVSCSVNVVELGKLLAAFEQSDALATEYTAAVRAPLEAKIAALRDALVWFRDIGSDHMIGCRRHPRFSTDPERECEPRCETAQRVLTDSAEVASTYRAQVRAEARAEMKEEAAKAAEDYRTGDRHHIAAAIRRLK